MPTPTRTLVAMVLAMLVAPPALGQDDFSATWHDGRAEINGYDLSVTRYGQQRVGQAVLIYVTEPFSESSFVKVDDPGRNRNDTFDALKLNLVRDFQTGLYDYNTMTSVFVRSNDFSPRKISFTSAEWCGHVYEEITIDGPGAKEILRSYFEGESGERDFDWKPGGVSEDNLYILLRGLGGAYLEPGDSKSVPFLPGALRRRLTHREINWTTATIERLAETKRTEVPAGRFETTTYLVRCGDGRTGTFEIETIAPHRIIKWSWSQGSGSPEGCDTAVLTGSERSRYWVRHDNGDERGLDELGVTPVVPIE